MSPLGGAAAAGWLALAPRAASRNGRMTPARARSWGIVRHSGPAESSPEAPGSTHADVAAGTASNMTLGELGGGAVGAPFVSIMADVQRTHHAKTRKQPIGADASGTE